MSFLLWHYSDGIRFYLSSLCFYLAWIVHYFSLPLLLKSLFAPWKKLIVEEDVGFNLDRLFQKLTFNFISRGIGATVRLLLFFSGVWVLVCAFLLGAIGFLFWVILPFLGLFEYRRQRQTLKSFLDELTEEIKARPQDTFALIFTNEAGQFLTQHLGFDLSPLATKAVSKNENLDKFAPKTYKELIDWFLETYGLDEEFFRRKGLNKEDLLLAARWWDEKRLRQESDPGGKKYFGRPGIGLELLFGYTPQLDNYAVDLSIPQTFSRHLIGRGQVVARIERTLSSGSSVFLVGQPGVGKKTVVLEFARRAAQGLLGPQMAYRRVLEVDYNFLLSETMDLNLKKTKLSGILEEASRAGNIILVIRDLHRLTNPAVEGFDLTDVFEQYLETKELKIIAITSPVEYERFLVPNLHLARDFQPVEVSASTPEEAMSILMSTAEDWEAKSKNVVLVSALKRILEGSEHYITETPFPEKALDLFDEVAAYVQQRGERNLTVADVDKILSEKTGISFGQLAESTKKRLGQLEEIIHQRLVNQETAVSLIAKSLRASSVGTKSKNRPLGSFLFLGPTGVGKTQTAKVLAQVYYGSEKNILRFDMAEYAGDEGLSRLIGSLSQNQPGTLTTAIKNRPASLLLLDEIEKAPREVTNLFLTLLDEGFITDTFNRKFDCRHLFVIATSNAGAEYIRGLVSQNTAGGQLQKKVVEHILRGGLFTPEFLNRFDGVVVFEPLKTEYLSQIARLLLEELKEGLKKQNIGLEITPEVCDKLAGDGFDPAFGARPMRRIVDLVIGDLLGKGILGGEIKAGDKIKIVPGSNKGEYLWEKVSG